MLGCVIVVAVLVVSLVALVAARRVDGPMPTACLLALLPYGAVAGLVAGAVTLAMGRWLTGGTVLASGLILGADLVPRLTRTTPNLDGPRIRLMASNLLFGQADVKAVVELVRRHHVDVLHLLELTAECADELARAGLSDLLPHQVSRPAPGGEGSAVLSRHPLTELALVGPTRLAQPSARVDLGDTSIDVVAVHPVPPTESGRDWRTELSRLPEPDPNGPVRILAGDFNATPDHAAFRRLLRAGYRDAGIERGAALRPTWSAGERVPLFPLDHVLVDPRATVVSYRVFDVPGSDHKAVLAELVLTPR